MRDKAASRHPDLVTRGWDTPTSVDQVWVVDFSSVWTLAGFVYVAVIVDVYSRRILGWRVSVSTETLLVSDAMHQGFATRQASESGWDATGVIHHSDAGSHYTSVTFTAHCSNTASTVPPARSACSQPKPSMTADRPGATADPWNGTSLAGSTGATTSDSTP